MSSALGGLLLPVLACAALRAVPAAPGFTRIFGLAVAALLPAIPAVSLLFVVTGYGVDRHALYVRRLLWSTRIPLAGLQRVHEAVGLCKGTRRLFGNGGLFSFTGLYSNPALGRLRLVATDLRRPVVLVLPRRTVIVTPADPPAFIAHVERLCAA